MPALTSILVGAGLALSMGSTIYGAVAAKDAADEQAALQDKQAQMELEAAQAEAGQIREKARRLKASQRAGLASAGVALDGGTPDALLDETTRLSEQDAMAALSGGTNRAALLKDSASISRSKGNSALISGGLSAAGNFVSGLSSINKAGVNNKKTDLELNSGALALTKTSRPKYSLLGDTTL